MKLLFWEKFSRYLLIGLSAMVLLAGGRQMVLGNNLHQGPNAVLAEGENCLDPNQPGCEEPGFGGEIPPPPPGNPPPGNPPPGNPPPGNPPPPSTCSELRQYNQCIGCHLSERISQDTCGNYSTVIGSQYDPGCTETCTPPPPPPPPPPTVPECPYGVCRPICVPDGSCNPDFQPACGQSAPKHDNCGNFCGTFQAPACPPPSTPPTNRCTPTDCSAPEPTACGQITSGIRTNADCTTSYCTKGPGTNNCNPQCNPTACNAPEPTACGQTTNGTRTNADCSTSSCQKQGPVCPPPPTTPPTPRNTCPGTCFTDKNPGACNINGQNGWWHWDTQPANSSCTGANAYCYVCQPTTTPTTPPAPSAPSCVPNGICIPNSTIVCGISNMGHDNCGNGCTIQGPQCTSSVQGFPSCVLSPQNTTVNSGQGVTFSVNASSPNGSITRFDWDSGNGFFSSGGQTNTLTFFAPTTVTVRVTDQNNQTATCSAFVNVNNISNNNLTCVISPPNVSGPAPLTANFTGSGNPASGRSIVSFSWDLDGNGTFGDASGPSVSRVFNNSSNIALQVTDSAGQTAICNASVTIQNTTPPPPTNTLPPLTNTITVTPTNTNTNTNTNSNNNTNTSSSSSSSSATGGSSFASITLTGFPTTTTTTAAPAHVVFATQAPPTFFTTASPSAQVAGFTVLPKTGLPALAWTVLAFIPAGLRLRRFSKVENDFEDHPQYIWDKRKFESQSDTQV